MRLPLLRQHSRQLAVGGAVFALALAAIVALRSGGALHPPYPRAKATRAAQRDSGVHKFLGAHAWTTAKVIALDRTHWRVTFFDGPRYVLDAAVDRHGIVDAVEQHPPSVHPAGSATLWTPALLVLLAALFVLALGVQPLRSMRNLDALVLGAGFTLSALLLDARLVGPHVYVGMAALLYVAARCGRVAFGAVDAPEPVVAPLYRRAFAAADPSRVLALISVAALVGGLLLVITSTGISDVAFAGLAGATLLNHGTSPYGHITHAVVHGDTYPLLTYVLYMPFAAISPVRDAFDSLDGGLWLNALALVAAAALLLRMESDARAGLPRTLAWLVFPPVLLAASGGGNDVPAAVFATAALLTVARPGLSSGLFTLAGWVKIGPAAALIAYLPRLDARQLRRALAVVAALLAAGIVAMLAVGGTDSIDKATSAIRFQFERGSWFSLWQQLDARWLQEAFQALTAAFAVVGVMRLRASSDKPGVLRRAAAFAAALLALVQIGANYWTYAYLPWIVPFILVALFPPERQRSPQLAPLAP